MSDRVTLIPSTTQKPLSLTSTTWFLVAEATSEKAGHIKTLKNQFFATKEQSVSFISSRRSPFRKVRFLLCCHSSHKNISLFSLDCPWFTFEYKLKIEQLCCQVPTNLITQLYSFNFFSTFLHRRFLLFSHNWDVGGPCN